MSVFVEINRVRGDHFLKSCSILLVDGCRKVVCNIEHRTGSGRNLRTAFSKHDGVGQRKRQHDDENDRFPHISPFQNGSVWDKAYFSAGDSTNGCGAITRSYTICNRKSCQGDVLLKVYGRWVLSGLLCVSAVAVAQSVRNLAMVNGEAITEEDVYRAAGGALRQL